MVRWFRLLLIAGGVLGAHTSQTACAQQASLELLFTPTHRAQIAVWVERADGTFVATLALTHATATYGIGNRPGALQMNSGYRWPYGRREGVLPVWAHRRAAQPGAALFRRVIFQDRVEGKASRTTDDYSVDDYFCLSFTRNAATREALDAVTCPSVFSSDKGRYITQADLDANYAEPFEPTPGNGLMRRLDLFSLYPPRRDVIRCDARGCFDHPDVAHFAQDAFSVMPELDAIARATPQGYQPQRWLFPLPSDWDPEQDYRLFVEVNTEGDYNDHFNPQTFPTPTQPDTAWDHWAVTYGYPYRGQPSAVYEVPFRVDREGGWTGDVVGYGSLHGEDGTLHAADRLMSDSPDRAKGSGFDRLIAGEGARLELRVWQRDPCETPSPPPECGLDCTVDPTVCGDRFVCDAGECRPVCIVSSPPDAVGDLELTPHPNRKHSHTWAELRFLVPRSDQPIGAYEVKVSDGLRTWDAQTPDADQEVMPVALNVCAGMDDDNPCLTDRAGDLKTVTIAGLKPETTYTVSVAARDATCQKLGPASSAEVTTDPIQFTTVSPCFVASAAFGTPLAAEVGALRRFRDRYLMTHAPGRALVGAYYSVGPRAAAWLQDKPVARRGVRAVLSWLVEVARWLER